MSRPRGVEGMRFFYWADRQRVKQRTPDNQKDMTGEVALILIAFIAMIGLSWFGIATLRPAHAETTMYVTVSPGSVLNARFTPSKGAEIVGRLERGDKLVVTEIKDGWATVILCGDTLYCSAKYLSDHPPTDEPTTYTVAANGRVKVRKTPDGEAVGWVYPGDTVQVLGWVDGWARTAQGYISNNYLEEQK